ncbi:hypothetical protein C8R42DRAFT_648947 [Lentinula raphanica]|nr:hypothetical protein C8R42DRAFT_649203 [Lentinula raphanica]KAJ3709986.1 hypothetical protein C8R42DRAFT_649072 [Lentinula raphanica]KAJ3710231.1 hypothetical protein C8R42DRAFT_648947 [Lentinula raphanica]
MAASIASPMPLPSSGPSKGIQKSGKPSKRKLDFSNLDWSLCIGFTVQDVPEFVNGYRTKMESSTQWLPVRPKSKADSNVMFGAYVAPSDEHVFLKIGTATMTDPTRLKVLHDLSADIIEHRSHKLPNPFSIHQVLMLLEKGLIKHKNNSEYLVYEYTFNLPSYQNLSDKLVSQKGTGAGFAINKVDMPWEWDLYEKIEKKQLDVRKMLDAKKRAGF